MPIGGFMKCDICKNPVLPEAAEECACGRDVCERCGNHHNSGEFECCDICKRNGSIERGKPLEYKVSVIIEWECSCGQDMAYKAWTPNTSAIMTCSECHTSYKVSVADCRDAAHVEVNSQKE